MKPLTLFLVVLMGLCLRNEPAHAIGAGLRADYPCNRARVILETCADGTRIFSKGYRHHSSRHQRGTTIHYYTNSAHRRVQSPTRYDKAPAGATAQCRDLTYSFSQSRRGTCSHHGG